MITKEKLKRIGVDVLGVLLVIAAGLTSPIPGPGGLPLLILGLSLLATNHEWADRWLKTVKKRGLDLSDKLFSDNPRIRWAIDIASILLIAIAAAILTLATRSLAKTAAISLILAGIFLLLGNRDRIKSLRKKLFKRG